MCLKFTFYGCVRGRNSIIVICILVFLCFQFCFPNDEGEKACGRAVVQRSQSKSGFHRDLVTYVEWDLSLSSLRSHFDVQDCQLLLVEHFPSGIYVDPDQIKDGEEFGGREVFSTEIINVESLAHHSSSLKIFLFPKSVVINSRLETISANISIPIHLRYHQAALGKTFVAVSLLFPSVLGRCNGIDKRLATQCGAELIKAPCNAKIPSVSCDWIILTSASKEHSISSRPLTFHVPVGQIEHSWSIVIVTVLSTMAGCGLTLWNSLTRTTSYFI